MALTMLTAEKMSRSYLLLALFGNICTSSASELVYYNATEPTIELGAIVFQQRCTVCHGSNGMGEGYLPLSIPDYPSTNLSKPQYAKTSEQIKQVLVRGRIQGSAMSPLSPPLGNDLTWTEIESVTLFVETLRKNPDYALKLRKQNSNSIVLSKNTGRRIYKTRCAMCHGDYGAGDGRMARILKDPFPFDLTKSTMSDNTLDLIIKNGGESVGRSPRMPPWSGEFSENEIKSVIQYIKTLRE